MKSSNNVTSWAAILSAATSLVLMICLFGIDSIVRGTLYNYGLHFSYSWAGPYLRLTQIGFAAGWINIIIAFAIQLNIAGMRRTSEQPIAAPEKAWEAAKAPETEKASEGGLEERKEAEPAKSPEEVPTMAPESEAQEKKEEPQQPEQAPEQEPQQPEQAPEQEPQQPEKKPETKPEETPSLIDLFQ